MALQNFVVFCQTSTWISHQFSSFQSLSRVRLFVTQWIAARQASLSITNSQNLLKLMSIESVMPSSNLILCCPLLLLPSIPSISGSFQWVNSSHEVSQSTGVSALASVLPMNTQDWSPLEWTGWIITIRHPLWDILGEGNGTPLQYSCLENPMDGGAWWATVHGVAKSRTRPSDFNFTLCFHALEKEMATHSSILAWRIPGTGKPGWAAVYGVAQSRTRLKRLSSSSSSMRHSKGNLQVEMKRC